MCPTASYIETGRIPHNCGAPIFRHGSVRAPAIRRTISRRGTAEGPARRSGARRLQAAGDQRSALDILGLSLQRYSKSELRAAYIEKMKRIHPDVSLTMSEEEATDEAKAVNLAYQEALAMMEQQGVGSRAGSFVPQDEFDRTVGEPSFIFVNPFACNADPMLWREVQQVAQEAEDPAEALMMRGVRVDAAAILYVTSEQQQVLYEHLGAMSDFCLDMEAAAWFLDDMVARARSRANARQAQ